MKWQRGARWLVAATGLGTAIVLYTQTRERPEVDRPPVATPADPEASLQSSGGTSVRFRDGGVELQVEHDGELVYPDGRTVWRDARLQLGDGTTLAAGEIENSGEQVDGQPANIRLRERVEMVTPEGATVGGAEATYDHTTGVAVLPGPVTFTRGRISGAGTGGEYYRDTGVFNIQADAHIETSPDESGGTVTASAETMTFNRASQAMLFEGGARIVHSTNTMTGDRATLYLADDQERFRVIELRGNAAVTPEPGSEASVPEMRAADISLSFYEGTDTLERAVLVGGSTVVLAGADGRRSIDATNITLMTAPDGRTVTSIDARERVVVQTPSGPDRAGRTISAARLVATGNSSGLTEATFTGGVRLVENPVGQNRPGAGDRTANARTMVMDLDGQFDRVQVARFSQDVEFTDGEMSGDGERGEYDARAGRLILRSAPGSSRLPHVRSRSVTVDARDVIDVDLNSGSLEASGDVKTVSSGADEDANRTSAVGLLDSSQTMVGFSSAFQYDAEAGTARYVGTEEQPARVTQGETAVAALAIELSERTEDLTADQMVDTTFVASASTGAGPQRYRVRADTLEYRQGERTATYTGVPVTLTAPDGTTQGQTMVLTLAAEQRTLDRLDARVDVHATLPSGREALADSLLYEAATGHYTLRGTRGRSQVVLRAPGERPGTCTESRGLMVYFTSGGEPPEFPAAENPGQVIHVNVACSAPLTR